MHRHALEMRTTQLTFVKQRHKRCYGHFVRRAWEPVKAISWTIIDTSY